MTRVGITGHQGLQSSTRHLVTRALDQALLPFGAVEGITSLAEGADQLFAELVLDLGGKLTVIVPCAHYEDSFETNIGRSSYQRLRARAAQVVELPYDAPSEQAYWAAGQRVVDLAEILLAVWDGKPSGGLGGTADVVDYASTLGVPVRVIWPAGANRT